MAGYGYSRKFGFTPPKPHPVPPAARPDGAYGFSKQFGMPHGRRPGAVPPAGAGLTSGPPAGSFDPALAAQGRAAERGEHDTLQDIRLGHHFAETDLGQALRDIRTTVARKRQSLGIDRNRGNERIGNSEADTNLKAERTRQDFQTKLIDIGRQFADLGHRQGEAANAAGVGDAGTSAAAAAARARNQQFAEAPIHTAEGRLTEDLATALGRLGTSREQLSQDFGIATSQLNQDRDRERRGVKREFNRKYGPGYDGGKGFLGTEGIKEQRTKREGAVTQADLLEQEIYQARLEHPGAFAGWQRNGGGNGAGGGAPKHPAGPALARALVAPPKRRKR